MYLRKDWLDIDIVHGGRGWEGDEGEKVMRTTEKKAMEPMFFLPTEHDVRL
jgi:hypothetical protein